MKLKIIPTDYSLRITYMNIYRKQNNGYITLISVMIVGAIGLSIAVALILLGIGAGKTSQVITRSAQSRGLANLCTQVSLLQIRNNNSFTGSNNLSIGAGQCTYTVSNTGGTTREIQSIGNVEGIIRKVKVNINQLKPTINISEWLEIDDF